MDFDNMEAGREMDDLMAERVLKWKWWTVTPDINGEHGGNQILIPPTLNMQDAPSWLLPGKGPITRWSKPLYSERIEDAWPIIESHFRWPKFYVRIQRTSSGKWRCDIELNGGDGPTVSASAENAPLAICRAALKAVGGG